MRIIVMGAGAVGALVGVKLAAAGHQVSFWVRPSQRAEHRKLCVERTSGAHGEVGARSEWTAQFFSEGDTVPPSDWVFVCVRGEQVDDALATVVRHLGPDRDVVVSSVSFDSLVPRARQQGLRGVVLTHHISFGVWRDPLDPAHFFWFPFDAPSAISAEGQRLQLPEARAVAAALDAAGLRTGAALSVRGFTKWMMGAMTPFLAAWDICDFQPERLAGDRELRSLTARAMREASSHLDLPVGLRLLALTPARLYSALLRFFPKLIGRDGRAVWLHHGPKIREQTRYCLQFLLAQPAGMPALRDIARRFEAKEGPAQ